MGLLKKIPGKGDGISISAPCAGTLIALQEVKDPTFGTGILGQGAAIVPSDGKFYAPADGVAATLFPTGHAAAIRTAEGAEVLLHIGLDTVKLNGQHFTIHVEAGQQVKKGDLLLEADLAAVREAGFDTTTPVVICNSDTFSKIETCGTKEVAEGDEILRLIK
ncbi:MAG: PTS glucose transporter subunit IIA [Bacteroidales bacterium]|nr:PTS glucose transporter subunit IIA [Bacteroidales bacterium]MCM1416110.1 PTS glucose transporter subunit IIA [bacterium]MCM1422842.1 PTS glucose transporter subunit IIA [bacterium]